MIGNIKSNLPVIITVILMTLMFIGANFVHSAAPPLHPNEKVFLEYPSDGTAFNEIHRYYGDCRVFGEAAAICYDSAYMTKTKKRSLEKLYTKHWIISQGQADICNLMFNKGAYDQFMGVDMGDLTKISESVFDVCNTAITNIQKKEFNKDYGTKK